MVFNWTGKKDTEVLANEVKRCLLCPGSVALLPTETVYALVCRAGDAAACEKIVALKNRPASKRFGCIEGEFIFVHGKISPLFFTGTFRASR